MASLAKEAALGLLLVGGPALAPAQGATRREVLTNGLTVLLREDHSTPLVSVAVMYRVGARNEAAGVTGIAHYVEHMCFRATERFPGHEITEAITRIGGRWNGYTWIDQTYYAETVPRGALDTMLDIEADRMAQAVFEAEDFQKERTSILAELRSYDDPESVLYDAVLAASFEIHPYRNNTIGWPSDVEGITRDEAFAFYRKYYHPANAVLAVVGDMDPEATLEKIRLRFAGLTGAGVSTEVRTKEPPQPGQRRVRVRRPGPEARVTIVYRAPALADPDFPALVLFDALLAGGKGFRPLETYPVPRDTPLLRATVGRGLAAEARSAWQVSRDPYVYTFTAALPDASGLAPAESALFDAVADASRREWTAAEIEAARRQVRMGWARDLDEKAGWAHQLALFEVCGSYRELLELPSRVAQVSTAELRRFAQARLQAQQATVGWFEPVAAGEEGAVAAAAPDKATPPPAEEEPSLASPPGPPLPATETSLANGLRFVVQLRPGAALVSLVARIEAGSMFDDERPGLAALAVERLSQELPGEEGPPLVFTLRQDPQSITNSRYIELAATGLADDLPAILRKLAGRVEALAQSLPPEAFAALVRSAAAHAREAEATADGALWRAALEQLYPKGTPLARPAWGDAGSFGSVAAASLERFLAERVRPARMRLALAGGVEATGTVTLLRSTLGGLRSSGAEAGPPLLAAPRGRAELRTLALVRTDAAQNRIAVVWPGDRSRAEDAPATRVLLYLLGETGYSGRLGRALVEPGLVYSVYATLEEEGAPGFLRIVTAASPADTPEVLRRIRAVLERLAAEGITEAELAEARAYLAGTQARSREGTAAAAAAALTAMDRPDPAPWNNLTLAQVNGTARRLPSQGASVALVAGPGQ